MTRPDHLAGKLAAIFDELDSRPDVQQALSEHLLGGTPATQVARDLTATGFPVSATTIKDYRVSARESGLM